MSKLPFDNEEELENFVFKKLDKYFSEDKIFIGDKKKLKTRTGKGTLPDGILLDIANSQICLIENEMSGHDVFKHIGAQIIKFMVAYNNEETKKYLRRLFREVIEGDPEKYFEMFKRNNPEISEFQISGLIEEIIEKDPELYIFIDKIDEDLEDFCLIFQNIINIRAIEVLKLRFEEKIDYSFNDIEYTFIKGESEPLREKGVTEKYRQIYFELLREFKNERPNSTNRNTTGNAYLGIPVGIGGFHVEWWFMGREPNKILSIGIHLEKSIGEINYKIFDFFKNKEDQLISLFTEDNLIFDKKWTENWSRIYIEKKIGKLDDFYKSNELKKWALDNMIKFYDFFINNITEIKSQID